jgi:hypothetical protein
MTRLGVRAGKCQAATPSITTGSDWVRAPRFLNEQSLRFGYGKCSIFPGSIYAGRIHISSLVPLWRPSYHIWDFGLRMAVESFT